MSEKRRPAITLIAEIHGKRTRVELFEAKLWPDKIPASQHGRYRVRIDGKWPNGFGTHTLSNVFAQLRRHVKHRASWSRRITR